MTLTLQCGMPVEKSLLKRVFGNDAQILTRADLSNLDSTVSPSCTKIASIGLCGGVAPDLVADLVIAYSLVNLSYQPDTTWYKKITDQFNSNPGEFNLWQDSPYYSSGVLNQADTVEQRALLFKTTKAIAIDDESYAMVQFAAKKKIPYLIFRSVSDQWTETLPPAARGNIMNSDGSTNTAFLEASLQSDPEQVFALEKIATEMGKSLNTLETALIAFKDLIVG